MGFQDVIFSLGSEEYGLPIEAVQEITRLAEVHPIPKAPDYIKGLISIRGHAIPLIDLRQKFAIQSDHESEYAIIIEIDGNLVGFAVDEVKEVRTLENISPPPPLVNSAFIGGIVNLPDRIIIQVIPERILEDREVQDLSRLVG
ncbi:MAG: purine-binding chemotaxis protein CheW [Peptococcaceae bacterium]|nr:purine-binding chemotaxis protein CheW [Peptococcaceae bacterium]